MKLTDSIVFPVDMDADYQERLAVLKYLSEKLRSKVILLTVLPQDISDEHIQNKVEQAVRSDLQSIASILEEENIDSEIVIRKGKAASIISDVAEEYNAGLILAEARNCEKEGDYRLGTVVMRLMHLSDKPVMVTRLHETAGFASILCPTDFSKPAELALENAVLLAKVLKTELHVMSVEESVEYKGDGNYEAKDQKRLDDLQKKLEDYVKKFDITGLNVNTYTKAGEPEEAILAAIKKNGHDLLLMGTTGKTGLRRILMGSVTEKVIREIPCTFITTKSEDMVQLQVNTDISEFSEHYETAEKLFEQGFYDEAKVQYNICLKINSMHVPSLFKISKIHKLKGNKEKAEHYHNMAISVLDKVWDRQIEHEIRKHYS